MVIKDLVKPVPVSLTILPTHKCTAACEECCFGCTPEITHRMDYQTIVKHIDEATKEFPSIQVLIVSGGECFLLGDDLTQIICYAKTKNLFVRVVTNGYWASTYDHAIKRLKPLIEAGLNEINFSTGNNHQQYVPFENIINASLASDALGLKSIAISVEAPPKAKFTVTEAKNNTRLIPLIEKGVLAIIGASWIPIKGKSSCSLETKFNDMILNNKPCDNLFNHIIISPYSQLLGCCGLTVEYNKFLKLGDLNKAPLKELYEAQFNDLFKFWLYADGPRYIYKLIAEMKKEEAQILTHDCAYCMEICKDESNIALIKELFKENSASILYRFNIRNSKMIV